MKLFEQLGLSQETLTVIKQKGFETPTPIQEKVIPLVLAGTKDIVGQAQTGTGKTAAFGLPMIELLIEKTRTVQALVLTPTRELAIQVAEEIYSLKGSKVLSVVPIYGGQSIGIQLRSLKKGVDIVVGTPGRILDHLSRGTLKLDRISYLVLDEADEMLNMGFIDDVKEIIRQSNAVRRTMLFSATMPQEIMEIARRYMRDYELVRTSTDQLTVDKTDQIYFEVSAQDKFEALCRIIDIEEEFYGLVFCRTKIDVDTIANHLIERGYEADALHGDMSQGLREKILNKFKKRIVTILVATDVAARGIDIQDLTHVINYALPQDPESYVHRIGRTGRAGKEGNAITFITPSEYRNLQFISRRAKTDIRKARLPRVKDVINAKKLRISTEIDALLKDAVHPAYVEMAQTLLETKNPQDIIAALLEHSFPDELSPEKYVEIEDAVIDRKGTTRLFVSQGQKNGLTPQKLIQFIRNNCSIAAEKIRDIRILESFSFVTLPFHEAEILLAHLKKTHRGQGPFITKAKKPRR
jgi:ATP-dependent RNA helicase DeaD